MGSLQTIPKTVLYGNWTKIQDLRSGCRLSIVSWMSIHCFLWSLDVLIFQPSLVCLHSGSFWKRLNALTKDPVEETFSFVQGIPSSNFFRPISCAGSSHFLGLIASETKEGEAKKSSSQFWEQQNICFPFVNFGPRKLSSDDWCLLIKTVTSSEKMKACFWVNSFEAKCCC